MIQLSKRLRAIADKVEDGSRLADIGSDHALLPAFLAAEGRIQAAVAGELNPGPLEAAQKQIGAAGLEGKVSVRSGDGLQVIQPGEVDTIVIAGMGGSLISDILAAGQRAGKLHGVSRLVLQPNVGEELVRIWLRGNGWLLLGEELLEEDGKIYEILWAESRPDADDAAMQADGELYRSRWLDGFGDVLEEDWLRFGPFLLRRGEPLFVKKWLRETGKLERVIRSLSQSTLEESREKRQALTLKMNRLKELIACLQRGKPSFK